MLVTQDELSELVLDVRTMPKNFLPGGLLPGDGERIEIMNKAGSWFQARASYERFLVSGDGDSEVQFCLFIEGEDDPTQLDEVQRYFIEWREIDGG